MKRGGNWERTVLNVAHAYGWRAMTIRPVFDGTRKRWQTPVGADGAGWPDITLVRERIVVAELKSGTGRTTPAQRDWLERLATAGVEGYICATPTTTPSSPPSNAAPPR